MPSSLTSTKIKDTYGQVLHVDGGVTSTPKVVYDGDGTATALKVSTTDVQVNNSPVLTDADIGSTVQAYDADLTAWSGKTAPTGAVVGTSDSQALSNKTFIDNPVFSAGTANGVAYLNGSKVLTTGSALTFDGANLGIGISSPVYRVQLSTSSRFGYYGDSTHYAYYEPYNSITGSTVWDNYQSAGIPYKWLVSGSETMCLDSTGLGIGTSSPGAKLDIGNTNNSQFFQNSGATTGYSYGIIQNTSGNLLFGVVGSNGSFWGAGNAPYAATLGTTTANPLVLATNNAERMRIDSSGYIKCPGMYAATTGSAANMFVDSNGYVYRSTSSLKYKRDVVDAKHGLADVLKLRPVTYKGKAENDGEKVFGGLIAEEVDAAGLTEFVQYADDGSPDALAYGNMVSLCIKAIQELKAELDATKAEIAALKAIN